MPTGRIPEKEEVFLNYPEVLVNLAAAFADGEDCGYALHDALLEYGCPTAARHFVVSQEEWGQGRVGFCKPGDKGCFVIQELLGTAFCGMSLCSALRDRFEIARSADSQNC